MQIQIIPGSPLGLHTHLKPPLNGVNRRSGPLPQVGGVSLPRMRRHCRSHSTWSHEFIHALCDSSHLSSFVVRSLRCLLAYLCDGSPFADWGAAPAPQTPPKRSRPSSGSRHPRWRTTTYPSPLMPSWH